jgi:hypothetical protein
MSEFKSVWVRFFPPRKICDKLAVCQSKKSPSCPVGVCKLKKPVKAKNAA